MHNQQHNNQSVGMEMLRKMFCLACMAMLAAALVACGGNDAQRQDLVTGLRCTGALQSGWCWQQPQPHALATRDVYFTDELNGWLVGDHGLAMRTTDGGATWTEHSLPTSRELVQVRFMDARRGWIIATPGGELWRTEDGGQNWLLSGATPMPYPTVLWHVRDQVIALTGLSRYDASPPDVSAVSTDGGKSWQQSALVIDQIDGKGNLWGFNGARRSLDLGATVEATIESDWPVGSFVAGVSFGASGFETAKLLRWLPDSQSWQSLIALRSARQLPWIIRPVLAPAFQISYQLLNVTLDATGAGLAEALPDPLPNGSVGPHLRLARTLDAALTWQWIDLPAGGQKPSFESLQIVDGRTLWVQLSENGSSQRYLSTDVGRSWLSSLPKPRDPNDDRLRVSRDAAGQLMARLGNDASSWWRSTNQGLSWRELPASRTVAEDMIGVWISAAGRGFSVSLSGSVWDTVDNGRHWSARASGIGSPASDLRMGADGSGWIVAGAQLLNTVDGGKTWTAHVVSTLGTGRLVKLLYTDGDRLRVEALAECPLQGTIYFCNTVLHSSNDAGLTWKVGTEGLRSVDGLQTRAVGFATADTAIRVDGERVERSTDAGVTWNSVAVAPMRGSVNRIVFQDARNGWMIGFDGGARRTTDAGLTWTAVELPLPNLSTSGAYRPWLRDVTFADARHGWMVGDNGIVLATSDGGASWSLQPSGTPHALYTVTAIDSRTAWIAGAKGSILVTVSGGR